MFPFKGFLRPNRAKPKTLLFQFLGGSKKLFFSKNKNFFIFFSPKKAVKKSNKILVGDFWDMDIWYWRTMKVLYNMPKSHLGWLAKVWKLFTGWFIQTKKKHFFNPTKIGKKTFSVVARKNAFGLRDSKFSCSTQKNTSQWQTFGEMKFKIKKTKKNKQ